MNRRNRHLVVLLIALTTASLASFGVYRAVERMPMRPAEAPPQSVVIAARSMPIGTELTARDVRVVAWPSSSPMPGAISNVNDVVSRGLLTSVLQNEPITSSKLASPEAGGGLSPAIPRGMRAMSVRVNDVIGVAGFLVPGSKVDVVVTMHRGADSMTRTAASNVQVLTAGTRQEQQKEQQKPEADEKAGASTVVTLMVTPQDAERIALAQSEGEIMLVLRNPLDTEPTVTSGVRTAALLGPEEAPAAVKSPAPRRAVVVAPPPPADPPPPTPRTVEAIRAAKRTEEVIR